MMAFSDSILTLSHVQLSRLWKEKASAQKREKKWRWLQIKKANPRNGEKKDAKLCSRHNIEKKRINEILDDNSCAVRHTRHMSARTFLFCLSPLSFRFLRRWDWIVRQTRSQILVECVDKLHTTANVNSLSTKLDERTAYIHRASALLWIKIIELVHNSCWW